MQKNLVIVESPAKCKTIEKFLEKNFKVLASYGHIRDLPSKNGSVNPDDDFAMIYEVNNKSKKYIDNIVKEIKNRDTLWLATDPDREGEAIAWHVVDYLKSQKSIKNDFTVKRIVFSEITKNAIHNAINNPRELDQNLIEAQQARRALDYLVGFNLSPVLWRKLPGSRSAGRVQSVAVRLIASRDEEIESFKTQEYWTIHIDFLKEQTGENFRSNLTHINNIKLDKFYLNNAAEAKAVILELKQNNFAITNIDKKNISRKAAPPFITSTLQQEAARKLGFSAKRTMKVAQELYEGVKLDSGQLGLITYMRTDGVNLSQEAITMIRNYIKAAYDQNYLPQKEIKYKSKTLNAQEAHEAIRPTDINKIPAEIKQFLTDDQFKLYDLIWKRTLACQMKESISEATTVDIESLDKKFRLRTTGSVLVFDGFKRVYTESKDDDINNDESSLPKLTIQDKIKAEKFDDIQHFTEPPPRYTEASLVKKLEELGIGRPSTYANILSVIQDRDYVRLEKKRFICEDRGRIVTAFLEEYFSKYVEYDFTASLENDLDEISSGKINRIEMLKKFWSGFKQNIDLAASKSNSEIIEHINVKLAEHFFPKDENGNVVRSCPECSSGQLSIKTGKFGAFIGCSNYPECKYTKQFSKNENDTEVEISDNNQSLGIDAQSGENVSLRKGPYGFYVQLGEGKQPKRVAIPKSIDLNDINLAIALKLLSLPKELGQHSTKGGPIKLGIGKFGPFIYFAGNYHSINNQNNFLDITLKEAEEIISKSAKKEGKLLGVHPQNKQEIHLLYGRYGPYLKFNNKNYKIPKNENPEQIDLDKALSIISK